MTVDAHQGAVRLADDVGCAGLILQESELTKVLPWGVVVHDFFALLSLSSDALTFLDEVELVALLTGPDHVVTSLEALLNEGIREDRPLIAIHALEDLNLCEEFLILLTALARGILDDVVEGAAVKGPEEGVRVCYDGGRAWGVIEQCQFSEGFTCLVLLQEGSLGLTAENLGAGQDTALYHEKLSTILALGDDRVACSEAFFFHGTHYNEEFLIIQRLEEEGMLQASAYLSLSLLGLFDNSRLEVTLLVPCTVRLSADRGTGLAILINLGKRKCLNIVIIVVLICLVLAADRTCLVGSTRAHTLRLLLFFCLFLKEHLLKALDLGLQVLVLLPIPAVCHPVTICLLHVVCQKPRLYNC